jgi:acyl-CoA thioesterase FadM
VHVWVNRERRRPVAVPAPIRSALEPLRARPAETA